MAMEVSTGRRWLLPVSLPSSTHLQQHASRCISSLLSLLPLSPHRLPAPPLPYSPLPPQFFKAMPVLGMGGNVPEEVDALFRSFDPDGSGEITFRVLWPRHRDFPAALARCACLVLHLPAALACCTSLLHLPAAPAALACCTCLLHLLADVGSPYMLPEVVT